MAKTKDKFMLRLINELAKDGEKAINLAYNRRTFTNRLYNLHDSYASAVYVNGVLYADTIRYVGSEMSKRERETGYFYKGKRSFPDRRGRRLLEGDELTLNGRDEARRFFSDYKPNKKGVQLVMIAAMFYANILESGRLGVKYKVISNMRGYLKYYLAPKYKATTHQIHYWRNLDVYGKGSFTFISKKDI